MIEEPISFVQYKTVAKQFIRPDCFEYKPANGWKSVQAARFWILRKLKCFSCDETVEYERIVFKPSDLLKAIDRQRGHVLSLYHHEGIRLLIGADDFAELMNLPIIHSLMSFDMKYQHERRFMNMPVTIIPWMKGILVLPQAL